MISSINKLSIMRRVAAVLVCTACSLAAQASQVVDLGTLSVPGTYTYSNTFNAPTIGFLDDYTFTIPAANFDSITASLDLGQFFSISNLQARLYSGTGPFVSGTTPLLQAWSTAITAAPGTTGSVVVISPHDLPQAPTRWNSGVTRQDQMAARIPAA